MTTIQTIHEKIANKAAETDMKSLAIAVVMLTVLCGLAVTARAMIDNHDGHRTKHVAALSQKLVSPYDFQPIRAEVLSDNPHHYTIDVKKLANISVNEEAPVFAVYTESRIPDKCADFRSLEISYKKPSKYQRVFDLSKHKDVLKAIDAYGCVVMRNIPSKG